MSAIVFKKVAKNFEDNPALFETDFQIKEREFTVFVGPSGSWKNYHFKIDCRVRKCH